MQVLVHTRVRELQARLRGQHLCLQALQLLAQVVDRRALPRLLAERLLHLRSRAGGGGCQEMAGAM